MKLFKSLLVAPATLGLLAPLAANATEINLYQDYLSMLNITNGLFFNPTRLSWHTISFLHIRHVYIWSHFDN